MSEKNNKPLIIAIITGAILVSASLIYFSLSSGKYATASNENKAQPSDINIEDEDINTVEEYLEAYTSSEKFDEKVGAALERYIQKQEDKAREEQREAMLKEVENFDPPVVEGVSSDDDAILGDPNAPVTIIEFSDFECPYCKRSYQEVLPLIKEKYIDTGKAKYVFRDYPLPFHEPIATLEALAANCARAQGDDETYYAYHDLLYETTTSNKGLEEEQLYEIATELNLDAEALRTCVENETHLAEIEKDMEDASSYGITSTPSFFINGKLIKGAYPYEFFEKVIEDELNK